MTTFLFSHPTEYRVVGVAGRGAYAVVCKAEVLDPALADRIGLFESVSQQASSLSQQASEAALPSDATPLAAPAALGTPHVSPLQLLQRQASAAIAEAQCRQASEEEGIIVDDDPSTVVTRRINSSRRVVGELSTATMDRAGVEEEEASTCSPTTVPMIVATTDDDGGGGGTAEERGGDGAGKPVVAIKQLIDHSSVHRSVDSNWRLHYLRKVSREVEILHHFRDVPQIINLGELYVNLNEEDVYLVMPYLEHNLRQVVEHCPLEEELLRWIIAQVLLGLRAIHAAGVIHRDLTLANVLIDGNTWDARIADFGLSRARETVDCDITLDVVTLPYRAPELLLEYSQYTSAIDIWSLGCIFAEGLLRKPFLYISPEKNPDALKQLKLVFSKLTGFPDLARIKEAANERCANFLTNWHAQLGGNVPGAKDVADVLQSRSPDLVVSDQAVAVLRRMLVFNPHDRATAAELLQMPWFQEDESCRELIRLMDERDAPGRFTEYVEQLSVSEMQQLLLRRANGRRAVVDSYVTEPQP